MRNTGSRGFTIAEALATLSIFGFFMTVLFLTVGWGFRSFSLAVAKSDVTTEARRIALFIERDMQSSNYFSIQLDDSNNREVDVDSVACRRDAICFVSRDNWAATSLPFDSDKGVPNWNRYFIYYATKEIQYGRLIRLSIDPSKDKSYAGGIGGFPYNKFTTAVTQGESNPYLLDDPTGIYPQDVENVHTLASSIKSFEITLIPASQMVRLHVLLRQNGLMAYRANQDREGGTFELKYLIELRNTK